MAKTKQVKASDVAAAPKQTAVILAKYKPLPRFGVGCKTC